ncbi:MAG: tRNA (uracil-5-)-methyltransferase [Bacterioplanes sp.]|nr:tRNA (uracil-5-)-methyltransferase [Bacterioplanes sp.]
MAKNDNLVDFQQAAEKHRHRREHEQKEANVEAIRQRFAHALPSKATPVKDYLKKKRAKKKRYE